MKKLLFAIVGSILGAVVGSTLVISGGYYFHIYRPAKNAVYKKIDLTSLSLETNMYLAEKILKSSIKNSNMFVYRRLDESSAKALFQDKNILRFLNHRQIIIIKAYTELLTALNESNELYRSHFMNSNFTKPPVDIKEIKKNVAQQAAGFLSVCQIFTEEFEPYYLEKRASKNEALAIKKDIEMRKNKILSKRNFRM